MLILNQDHDHLYDFNGELHSMPAIHNEHIIGFNLYTNNMFLGTFDTLADCIKEMQKIRRCTQPVYAINGFSDWNTIKELNKYE